MTEIDVSRSCLQKKRGDDGIVTLKPRLTLLLDDFWLNQKRKKPERPATPEPFHVCEPCQDGVTTR